MAFRKLNFSKSWKNANDFPTVETSEEKVRADLQLLHDETRDALNNLIDDLEEEGLENTVRIDLESQNPIRYIRIMDDRSLQVSTNGTEWDFVLGPDATIYDAHARKHKQGGDDPLTPGDIGAYTKDETLTPDTAAKFGLGEEATPNDVLSSIGEYRLHRWRVSVSETTGTKGFHTDVDLIENASASDSFLVQYSSQYCIDEQDRMTLASPRSLSVPATHPERVTDRLVGNYVTFGGESIYYFSNRSSIGLWTRYPYVTDPETGEPTPDTSNGTTVFQAVLVQPVSVTENVDVSYVTSSSKDEYPEESSSTSGIGTSRITRTVYSYLGMPLDKAANAAQTEDLAAMETQLMSYVNETGVKIVSGTYLGTGLVGAENPKTLTFTFKPILVIVTADSGAGVIPGSVFIAGQTQSDGLGSNDNPAYGLQLRLTWGDDRISWYSTSGDAEKSLNYDGQLYHYFALGL